jgi:hypothetical protein
MILPKDSIINNPLNNLLGVFYPNFLLLNNNGYNPQKMFGDLFTDTLTYSATEIHERIHWGQFVGTSWGNLCLKLNQCQADKFINASVYTDLIRILEDLKNIKISDNYQISRNDVNDDNYSSMVFLQNWIDGMLAQSFFMVGGAKFKQFDCLKQSIAVALCDQFTTSCEYFGVEDSRLVSELDELFTFNDFSISDNYQGGVLSTKDLFEGQARASELVYLFNFTDVADKMDSIENFNKLINSLSQNSPYWIAFNYFLHITNERFSSLKEFSHSLAKFCLLVDISFATPWPPFVSADSIGNLSWDDFYPTNRFSKACLSFKRININFNANDPNEHLKFVDDICSYLDWDTPSNMAKSYLGFTKKKNKLFSKDWENGNTLQGYAVNDYYTYVTTKFCELRTKIPTYIPNLGFSCIGDVALDTISLLWSDNNAEWILPPLQLKGEDKKLFTPIREDRKNCFQWLSSLLIHNSILNDFVFQNKIVDFSYYPFEVPVWVREYLIEYIKKNYSIEFKYLE